MKLSDSFGRAWRGAVINIAVRPMAVLASMADL